MIWSRKGKGKGNLGKKIPNPNFTNVFGEGKFARD